MADVCVYPAKLSGRLTAPPSKSAAHRALICGALSRSACTVSPVADSQDMIATLGVLSAMGATYKRDGDTISFDAAPWHSHPVTLQCKESGSTLRFLLPVAAALGLNATFCGEGRLPDRPIHPLTDQLKAHGICFSADTMPFTISGKLTGGRFTLPGDVSSQFVSGLLFALPLIGEDSEIILTSPLESAGYVEMTLGALAQSGIAVEQTAQGYRIAGNQSYGGGVRTVEGDYSNGAFWLCAGALSGEITVDGFDPASVQGDGAITEILKRFGGAVKGGDGSFTVSPSPLTGCRIDAAPIPDLVPILAVTAAFAEGDTEIYNAARLRIKESDRLATVAALIRDLGGSAEEYPDRLIVHGGGLRGGNADGANDHRIVMSAAIAALGCTEPVIIRGYEAVNKSYPSFFEDLKRLGGNYHVI